MVRTQALRMALLVAVMATAHGSTDTYPDSFACDDATMLLQLQHAPVPVDQINWARGLHFGPPAHNLKPDEYILSAPAADFGLTDSTALLDGSAAEQELFQGHPAPLELSGDVGHEFMQINDPGDHCAAGDQAGYSIINVSTPTLVPFIVDKDAPTRLPVAVIVAPGGGFRFLSWNKEGTRVAKWLNSIGVSAFVLKYRVPVDALPTIFKSVVDGQRAISLVWSRSSELNFEKVGIMGFSAGGAIAFGTSLLPFRSYKKTDTIDDENFKPDFAMLIYSTGYLPKLAELIPNSMLSIPDTFIALARNDPCVHAEDATAYHSELMKRGGHHQLHIYDGGHHGYGDCSLYVNGNQWEPACAWTVNAQLFIEHLVGVPRPLEPMIHNAVA